MQNSRYFDRAALRGHCAAADRNRAIWVLSNDMARRRKKIGVRIALGAGRGPVLVCSGWPLMAILPQRLSPRAARYLLIRKLSVGKLTLSCISCDADPQLEGISQ